MDAFGTLAHMACAATAGCPILRSPLAADLHAECAVFVYVSALLAEGRPQYVLGASRSAETRHHPGLGGPRHGCRLRDRLGCVGQRWCPHGGQRSSGLGQARSWAARSVVVPGRCTALDTMRLAALCCGYWQCMRIQVRRRRCGEPFSSGSYVSRAPIAEGLTLRLGDFDFTAGGMQRLRKLATPKRTLRAGSGVGVSGRTCGGRPQGDGPGTHQAADGWRGRVVGLSQIEHMCVCMCMCMEGSRMCAHSVLEANTLLAVSSDSMPSYHASVLVQKAKSDTSDGAVGRVRIWEARRLRMSETLREPCTPQRLDTLMALGTTLRPLAGGMML